jgi:hypothetical protein
MGQYRPRERRSRQFVTLAALTATTLLAAPAGVGAFDTGPHSDITRDALIAEGFGATAQDVVVVNNWFVDLYSNSSKIPQSGHADTAVSVLGAFFENDEQWPQEVLDAANRLHFDSSLWDVANVGKAQIEWERLQRATTQLLGSIKSVNGPNQEIQALSAIGMGLHALQDFYSHSNWIEQQGVPGVDGTDWSQLPYGSTPTWFDVPKSARDGLNVYIGASTGTRTARTAPGTPTATRPWRMASTRTGPAVRATPMPTWPPTSRRANGCARSTPRSATRRSGSACCATATAAAASSTTTSRAR